MVWFCSVLVQVVASNLVLVLVAMNFHPHPGFGESSQLGGLDLDIEWYKTVYLLTFPS